MVKITMKMAKSLGLPPGETGALNIPDVKAYQKTLRVNAALDRIAANDQKVILDFVHQFVARDIETIADRAAKVAEEATNKAMEKFYFWAANTFMTQAGRSTAEAALWNAGVRWKPLSAKYVEEKKRLGKYDGFWRFSDDLYKKFRATTSKRRKMFASNVGYAFRGMQGELRITIGAQLGNAFKDEGSWVVYGRDIETELMELGFTGNEEIVTKLRGRAEHYRPLLGPALLYYVDKIVKPQVIQELKAKGYKIKRIRSY